MTRTAIAEGNKKVLSAAPWDKVKYDRQIVAIAKVAEATAIYSDDKGIRSIAKSVDIPVISPSFHCRSKRLKRNLAV